MNKVYLCISLMCCTILLSACNGAPLNASAIDKSSSSNISVINSSYISMVSSFNTHSSAANTAPSSNSMQSQSSPSSSAKSSSSSSNTSSTATQTLFNPCPSNGSPCKILPLGDSITDGYATPGGYRIPLFQKAIAAGKSITFVGSQSNGPAKVNGVIFPPDHEGHSYWHVYQLLDLVPSPALDDLPHIILLKIGTNDVSNPDGVSAKLETLISQLVKNAPNALLVVAKIIPMDENDYAWALPALKTYNDAIPILVKKFSDQGKHVILADMYTGFLMSELADGIHPNQAGYERMANVWYKAIADYLH